MAQSNLQPLTAPDNKCHFLRTIPLEVRNLIYEHLLISDILSSKKSIYRSFAKRPIPSPDPHGLHPNILSASRQIYEEASAVLYGNKNTFFVEFVYERAASSPLFRSQQHVGTWRYTGARYYHILRNAAVKKVKSWRIQIGTAKEMSEMPSPTSFVYFCRALCNAHPTFCRSISYPKAQSSLTAILRIQLLLDSTIPSERFSSL